MKRDRLVLVLFAFLVVGCLTGVLYAAVPVNTPVDSLIQYANGSSVARADYVVIDKDIFLGSVNKTDILAYPQQDYSYLISTDGTTYYAKNGTTGVIDYQGTNCAEITNSAINSLPRKTANNGAGTIKFLDGLFWFNESIEYNDRTVWIVGNGITSTILILEANANCDLIRMVPTTDTQITFSGVANIRLRGNRDNNVAGNGIFIGTNGTGWYQDVQMQNVFVEEFSEDGFYTERGWGLRVTDSIFERNDKNGVNVDTQGTGTFEQCRFGGNGDTGAKVTTIEIRFISCESEGNGERGYWLAGSRCQIISGIIAGNDVNNGGFPGVTLGGTADYAKIIGVFFDGESKEEWNIEIKAGGENITITSNSFQGATAAALIDGGSNNIIRNNVGYTATGDIRLNGVDMEMWNSTAWIVLGP